MLVPTDARPGGTLAPSGTHPCLPGPPQAPHHRGVLDDSGDARDDPELQAGPYNALAFHNGLGGDSLPLRRRMGSRSRSRSSSSSSSSGQPARMRMPDSGKIEDDVIADPTARLGGVSRGLGVGGDTASALEVFDGAYKFAFSVPRAVVRHVPPEYLNITRLVLCKNYVPHQPASCPMEAGCKFVHIDADPAQLPRHTIHVNYAWRAPEAVTYRRLAAGAVLVVSPPNERVPLEAVPSEYVLHTRGAVRALQRQAPLSATVASTTSSTVGGGGDCFSLEGNQSERHVPHAAAAADSATSAHSVNHCAHFYLNRMCNRGEDCNFVHAIHIDPNAAPFQRAPARHRAAIPSTALLSTAPVLKPVGGRAAKVEADTADRPPPPPPQDHRHDDHHHQQQQNHGSHFQMHVRPTIEVPSPFITISRHGAGSGSVAGLGADPQLRSGGEGPRLESPAMFSLSASMPSLNEFASPNTAPSPSPLHHHHHYYHHHHHQQHQQQYRPPPPPPGPARTAAGGGTSGAPLGGPSAAGGGFGEWKAKVPPPTPLVGVGVGVAPAAMGSDMWESPALSTSATRPFGVEGTSIDALDDSVLSSSMSFQQHQHLQHLPSRPPPPPPPLQHHLQFHHSHQHFLRQQGGPRQQHPRAMLSHRQQPQPIHNAHGAPGAKAPSTLVWPHAVPRPAEAAQRTAVQPSVQQQHQFPHPHMLISGEPRVVVGGSPVSPWSHGLGASSGSGSGSGGNEGASARTPCAVAAATAAMSDNGGRGAAKAPRGASRKGVRPVVPRAVFGEALDLAAVPPPPPPQQQTRPTRPDVDAPASAVPPLSPLLGQGSALAAVLPTSILAAPVVGTPPSPHATEGATSGQEDKQQQQQQQQQRLEQSCGSHASLSVELHFASAVSAASLPIVQPPPTTPPPPSHVANSRAATPLSPAASSSGGLPRHVHNPYDCVNPIANAW